MVIQKYSKIIQKDLLINQDLYHKHEVKRGLRNLDGSGVLAGLTKISKVVGFSKIDNSFVPAEGILQYRGHSITELVSNRNMFEKAAYLLIIGKVPNSSEVQEFLRYLVSRRGLPKKMVESYILKGHSKDIMNGLAKNVLSLHSFDKHPDNLELQNQLLQSLTLIAQFPIIIAYLYQKLNKKKKFGKSNSKLNHAANFLYLMRNKKKLEPVEVDTLDLCLMLHMEHGGGNNSTFTTHVVTSSHTDIYSAIAASLGSLKGPLHGGANLSARLMMENIMRNVKDWSSKKELEKYLVKILEKKAFNKSGKIFGFGHPVYTMSDPRVEILRKKAKEMAILKNREKELALYKLMEELVPKTFAKVTKKAKVVSANVDFYSGFIYDCLDFPKELYTPLFAMARIVGWCAHRIEELTSGNRIIRPAYKNVG